MKNILEKYIEDPNSISKYKKDKLLVWCCNNYMCVEISNILEIIDKLCNRVDVGCWALEKIFLTRNEQLISKYFYKFQNYGDFDECLTGCNSIESCKLIYDEMENNSEFEDNKIRYVFYGFTCAIINNNKQLVEYIKQRYPEVNYLQIVNSTIHKQVHFYSTLCLSCMNGNIKAFKFISKELENTLDENGWFDVLRCMFGEFSNHFDGSKTGNKLFFDIIDKIIEKYNYSLDRILNKCYSKKIIYHLLNKNNLSLNLKSLSDKELENSISHLINDKSNNFSYNQFIFKILLFNVNHNHSKYLINAAHAKNTNVVKYILNIHAKSNLNYNEALIKAVLKKNNMSVIKLLINYIDKKIINVTKLLSNACYTGQREIFEYLNEHININKHNIDWNDLLESLCHSWDKSDSHNHIEFIKYIIESGVKDLISIWESINDSWDISTISKIFFNYKTKIIPFGKIILPTAYKFGIIVNESQFEKCINGTINNWSSNEIDIIDIFELMDNDYCECMNDLTYVCASLIKRKYNKCLELVIKKYPQFIKNHEILKYICCNKNNLMALDLFTNYT